MMEKRTGLAGAATLVLHACLLALFASSVSQQRPTPPAPLPVVVRLLQAEKTPAKPMPNAPAPPQPPKAQPAPPKPAEPPPIAPVPPPVVPVPPPVVPVPPPVVPVPTPIPKPVAPPPAAPVPVTPAKPAAPTAPALPVATPSPPAPPAPVATPTPPAPPTPAALAPARTDVSIPASYEASNSKPVYPMMSRRRGEQGRVLLRVLVKRDGSAGAVEVKSSSGSPQLDQAAADALKNWRFKPATIDGKTVDEWHEVPIEFKLPK